MRVLVTGASQGLGKAIVRYLWSQGHDVALTSRSFSAMKDIVDRLPQSPDFPNQQALIVAADFSVRSRSTPAFLVDSLRKKKWDRLDALINNAATLGPVGPCWENNREDWESTIRVNLLAPVELCRLAVPWLREGGAIVNLSGGGATSARPNFSAYAVAKAGLVRFTETMAEEMKGRLRVNAAAPGVMDTGMFWLAHSRIPGKTLPTKDSLDNAAQLVCWLASPDSAPITGKLISAVWDNWRAMAAYKEKLAASDLYTLRRTTPMDLSV